MNLATILLVCFLRVGPTAGYLFEVREFAAQNQSSAAATQPQSQPAKPTNPAPAAAAPAPPQSSTTPVKPAAKAHTHHKKAAVPDCSNSPVPATTGASSAPADAPNSGVAAVKPCPPPKIVVKNGGSDEPVVELKGSTSEAQEAYQRFSTEQLTAATEENLKKVADRELTADQQSMLSQIKRFMEQAKSAVAAGDLVRGRNLALKARLLSDELVKP